MTRDDGKAVWAIALKCFGAESLQQRVCAHIEMIYIRSPDLDRPIGVSNEALAEIVRIILDDVSSGERPLPSGSREMNRAHLQALLRLRVRLDEAILRDLPVGELSPRLKMYRAQADFGL